MDVNHGEEDDEDEDKERRRQFEMMRKEEDEQEEQDGRKQEHQRLVDEFVGPVRRFDQKRWEVEMFPRLDFQASSFAISQSKSFPFVMMELERPRSYLFMSYRVVYLALPACLPYLHCLPSSIYLARSFIQYPTRPLLPRYPASSFSTILFIYFFGTFFYLFWLFFVPISFHQTTQFRLFSVCVYPRLATPVC